MLTTSLVLFVYLFILLQVFRWETAKTKWLTMLIAIVAAIVSASINLYDAFATSDVILPDSLLIKFELLADFVFLVAVTSAISSRPAKVAVIVTIAPALAAILMTRWVEFPDAFSTVRVLLSLTGAAVLAGVPLLIRRGRVEVSAFYLLFIFHNLFSALSPAFRAAGLNNLVHVTSFSGLAVAILLLMLLLDLRYCLNSTVKNVTYLLIIALLPMIISIAFALNPVDSRLEFPVVGGAVLVDGGRLNLALHIGAFAMTGVLLWVALSEREAERKKLEEMNRSAAEMDKLCSLGRLAAGLAHEINNPLGLIVGNALLLAEDTEYHEIRSAATLIAEEAERCSRIVEGMLNYSRQIPAGTERVNLQQLVDKTVMLLGHSLRHRDVKLTVKLEDCPDVICDGNRLVQVFINLMTNALDAVQKGGNILIAGSRAGHMVEVSVEDDGPGISPEIRERIFDPFFTTKETGRGTGLGLSICRGILEANGGTLRVESRQGKGARIVMQLNSWEDKEGSGYENTGS